MADGTNVSINEIYKEQYAHFRAMNDILYKIPPLFSVAIGGLWYFAATQLKSDRLIAVGIFLFAAVVSVCSVFIMRRFSLAFSRYITNLNALDGIYAVSLTALIHRRIDFGGRFGVGMKAVAVLRGVFFTAAWAGTWGTGWRGGAGSQGPDARWFRARRA